MFIDFTVIELASGKGGSGCISFRREKYIPKGGPDGGNGGRGGSIFALSDKNIHTLQDVRYNRIYKAKNGQQGSSNSKTGKDGDDIMMSQFASTSPPLNIKALGDDFETLGTEIKLDSTTFDAARFTGYVKLNAGGSFSLTTTAGSNTSTLSSATDVFENGFIEKSMTPTGEQMTLKFNAFEGADGNGSSVDGTMALAAGGEYKLTLPNTGTGTSFSSTVKTKDMESITSSLVASEIAKKLRSDAVISSVSGKNSVSMLPDAGDKLVVKFAEQNYTLTMLSNGRDAVPATATFTVSSADEVASAGNRIHLVLSAGLETNIDLDYTINTSMKINKHLTTNLILQFIYDDNSVKRLQVREVMGIGLNLKI